MVGNWKFDMLMSLQNILSVNKWWNGGGGATGVGGLEELIKNFHKKTMEK